MLNKGDIVYISSFVDFQTVYVRRINNGTDRFKSFLENFSSCCALGEYSWCLSTRISLFNFNYLGVL